jgi:hypothetical protein
MKKIATLSANTLLSSALATTSINGVSSELIPHVEMAGESNKPDAPLFHIESTTRLSVEPVEVDSWSAEKNTRFKQLAREEALRDLSIEEIAELEHLTSLRRFETYPRSADEILWQRHQQKLTRQLVQALQAYVQFHETTHSAPKRPHLDNKEGGSP